LPIAGEVACIWQYQHRPAAVNNHFVDEVLGQEVPGRGVALAEHHQVEMARDAGDARQYLGITAAIDVDPFCIGQPGGGLGKGGIAGIARGGILFAGPGGDHADALCAATLAENAGQAGAVAARQADSEFEASSRTFAGIEMDHQVLERHGKLRSKAWG
jgi:hypothetical protein